MGKLGERSRTEVRREQEMGYVYDIKAINTLCVQYTGYKLIVCTIYRLYIGGVYDVQVTNGLCVRD